MVLVDTRHRSERIAGGCRSFSSILSGGGGGGDLVKTSHLFSGCVYPPLRGHKF